MMRLPARPLSAVLVALAGLPLGAQDDLVARLPEGTVATVTLRNGPATWEALRALLLPLPDGLPAGSDLLPMLLDLGCQHATGYRTEELVELLAPRHAVLALLAGEGSPEGVLLSEIDDAAEVQATLAHLPRRPAFAVDGGVLIVAADSRVVQRVREARARPQSGRHDDDPAPLAAFVDLAKLRRDGVLPSLWERSDPGGRFLLGPLTQAIDAASALTVRVTITARGLHVEATLDGSPLAGDAASRHLLAKGVAARALPPEPAGTLAAVHLDRSVAGLLRHLDDVLPAGAAAQAKGGLSTADTLLGGKSVVDDLLPRLAEPWSLFVVAGDAGDGDDVVPPPVRLPAFVLVAPVVDRSVESLLLRGASTLSFISNQERGRRGDPGFRYRACKLDGEPALVGEPLPWRGPGAPPIASTLSPTLRFAHGHAILATTEDGAQAMADALARQGTEAAGDVVRLHGPEIAAALRTNRRVLALGEVLKKGLTMRQAQQQLDVMAAIAASISTLEIDVRRQAGPTEMVLDLVRGDR